MIVPPYLLEALARSDDTAVAERARRSMQRDRRLRPARGGPTAQPGPAPVPVPNGTDAVQRVVYDAQGTETLPGARRRGEGEPAGPDQTVNEAYDGLGATWTLYHDAFNRNSLDDKGLPLLASVHYGQDYDNAFWNGSQMVFGDGDGDIFNRFTESVDVIGHELTHGVTEHTAGLTYSGQSGALNESVSDVFGSLVRQRTLGQTADQADWLIGKGLFTAKVHGVALRNMEHPGTAYDDPVLGKDPQPDSMAGYLDTTEDNGGVHTNSGITNRAFVLVAKAIGGNAWEAPGQIWYDVLTGDISADCDFATFAELTVAAAGARFGQGSAQQQAVQAAWTEVGVLDASSSGSPGAPDPKIAATDALPDADPGDGDEDLELMLLRTGGFAGQRRTRTVRVNDLPTPDADAWRDLLHSPRLAEFGQASSHPDAFSYQVRCPRHQVDVSVPEPGLPTGVRDLFQRTLAFDPPGDQASGVGPAPE